jgi:hypothetical protein
MNRYYEDFELWCRECVTITDKLTGRPVPFTLNAPQRRVLAVLEQQRHAHRPLRLILLKARQWGGSTLVQVYMAWMQLVRRTGWNSLICGHVKDASANIRGMYSRLLRDYPIELKTDNPRDWTFVPYEKSQNMSHIPARDCRVTLASAQSPDGVRGGDYAMAHLSEVAFWGDDDWSTAEKIVRTIAGSIPMEPETLVVMESTANGEGNYFHAEWMRAVNGQSDKVAVFVPWHEIEIYSRPVADEERASLIASLDDYERSLMLDLNVSLEHVAWYHDKRREYTSHYQMMAEYPSTAEEAFASSGQALFDVDRLGRIGRTAAEGVTETHARLVSLIPGDGGKMPHLVALSGVGDGEVMLLDHWEIDGGLRQAVAMAEEMTRCHRAKMVLLCDETEKLGSCRWAMREAMRSGVPMLIFDEEDAIVDLTPQLLTDMVDNLRDIIDRGRLRVCSDEVVDQLRTARRSRARGLNLRGRGLLTTCLAMAHLLAESADNVTLNPVDFY